MARLPRLLLLGILAGHRSAQGPVARGRQAQHHERRVAGLFGRPSRVALLAARSNQRLELQSAAGRVAVQDRYLGPRPEYKLEGTPVMVKGTLYTTGGTRRSVVSLDGRTGELNWAHSLREGRRAAVSPRQLSGRGVSYWTDGKGDERVIYVTTGLSARRARRENGRA